jgi:diaminopimelate epimerase
MSHSFTKMHGAGNDFVLLDGRNHLPANVGPLARAMANRQTGVGFDQLLVVRNGATTSYAMEIWNSDGSRAEMCGNGIRCFAKWLFDQGEVSAGPLEVETLGGVRQLQVSGYRNTEFEASVGMGVPDFDPTHIPLDSDDHTNRVTLYPGGIRLDLTGVSMGNPHAVAFRDDLDRFPLSKIGPLVEFDPAFPERINFEIVHVVGPRNLEARVWERGTGITMACGTGAAAAVAVAIHEGRIDPGSVDLDMPGGTLRVTWSGANEELILRGPAVTVFNGIWPTD